jgi:hypothetical protein
MQISFTLHVLQITEFASRDSTIAGQPSVPDPHDTSLSIFKWVMPSGLFEGLVSMSTRS